MKNKPVWLQVALLAVAIQMPLFHVSVAYGQEKCTSLSVIKDQLLLFKEREPMFVATNKNIGTLFDYLIKQKLGKTPNPSDDNELVGELAEKCFITADSLDKAYNALVQEGKLERLSQGSASNSDEPERGCLSQAAVEEQAKLFKEREPLYVPTPKNSKLLLTYLIEHKLGKKPNRRHFERLVDEVIARCDFTAGNLDEAYIALTKEDKLETKAHDRGRVLAQIMAGAVTGAAAGQQAADNLTLGAGPLQQFVAGAGAGRSSGPLDTARTRFPCSAYGARTPGEIGNYPFDGYSHRIVSSTRKEVTFDDGSMWAISGRPHYMSPLRGRATVIKDGGTHHMYDMSASDGNARAEYLGNPRCDR